MRQHAPEAGLKDIGGNRWTASNWAPEWWEDEAEACDTAALAGTQQAQRFETAPLPADPFFQRLTCYPTYRTAGQRAACRAAVSVADGATLICMLPTGSGKTEVAISLEARRQGVTILLVPTLTLAADFERRLRDNWVMRHPRVDPSTIKFAWTSTTSDADREAMRRSIEAGHRPVVCDLARIHHPQFAPDHARRCR